MKNIARGEGEKKKPNKKSLLGCRCSSSVHTEFVIENYFLQVSKCEKILFTLKKEPDVEGKEFLMVGWVEIPGSSQGKLT